MGSTSLRCHGDEGRATTSRALTNVYTANDMWVGQLVNQLRDRVNVSTMRALGFCVSVEHARFMARQFERRGISARAVWGDSSPAERRSRPWRPR